MKKNQKVFLAFTLFAILLACEQEYPFSSFKATKRDLQSEVNRVRQWYDQNKPDLVQTKSGLEDELSIMMAPNWSESFLREDENYETVEVAVAMNKRITYMTPVVRDKYFSAKDEKYKQDMRRFIFLTDKKTHKQFGFVMLIVPELDYLERTNFRPFQKNTYLERDEDFSGYVLYYELDGTFANGWRYEDGELVRKVTETPYRYHGDRLERIRTKARDCDEYDIHQLIEECTDHYTYVEYGGEVSDWQYSHTTCVYYDEITGTYIECIDTDGSHSGGYQPPTDPVDPEMGKFAGIYSSQSSLSDEEKQSLFGAFDGLVNPKPIYEKIIQSLEDSKIRINFKTGFTLVDPVTKDTVPAIYKTDRSITFINQAAITTNNLEEELLHAVQHLENGGIRDDILNYELEAKFFRDVVFKRYGLGKSSLSIYLPEEEQSNYESWIDKFAIRDISKDDILIFDSYAQKAIDPLERANYQSGFSYKLLENYLLNFKF